MIVFPPTKQAWTSSLKWVPQWVFTLPEDYTDVDPIGVTYSALTVNSPIQNGLIRSKPTLSLQNNLFGVVESIDAQLNNLIFTLQSIKESFNFGVNSELFPVLYYVEANYPTTVEILTDSGYVTLPKARSLFEFLFSGYTTWFWDAGVYIGGVGLKVSNVTDQTIPEVSRDIHRPVWTSQENNRFLLIHPSQVKGNTLQQDTDWAIHYVEGDFPDQIVKLDGVQYDAIAQNMSTDQYYSNVFSLPDLGDELIDIIPLHRTYVKNQSKNSVIAALSLSFNDFNEVEYDNGDSITSSILSTARYILRKASIGGNNIDAVDPIDWLGFNGTQVQTVNVTGSVVDKSLKNMIILQDTLRNQTYLGPGTKALQTTVEIENITKPILSLNWAWYDNSFRTRSGTFE